MPATILVIDADTNAQQQLRKILEDAGYRVISAVDGLEGVRLLAMESPGLILLDVALPSSDGYQLVARIRRDEARTAHVPIIMLTAERDVEQKIRSLRAGADDYLVKPMDPTFHPAELLARTRSLLARFSPPEPEEEIKPVLGRVLAFYGAKGGVGTTTIAINSAIALQREGRSVCLVDANLQLGDHRVFLDLGADVKSVVDGTAGPGIEPDVVKRIVAHHESGIGLLLAPPTPESADLIRPEQMTALLSVLRGMYDYVIVDLDKRLDDMNLGMIEVADTVYIVLNADLACLKNVRLVLQTLGHLGESTKLRLIMNRSTAVTGINIKSAEGALKRTIDHRVVNDYRAAIGSLNSGAPFQVSRPDSAIGRSIAEFVKTIDQQAPDKPAKAGPDRTASRPAFLRR